MALIEIPFPDELDQFLHGIEFTFLMIPQDLLDQESILGDENDQSVFSEERNQPSSQDKREDSRSGANPAI